MSASDSSTFAEVCGSVAPGFEAVREAFCRSFADGLEVGASVAVYKNGVPVVDLWGGYTDAAQAHAWTGDTVTLVYSVTKGAVATLFNLLDQEGELDLDRPISSYWPEFAAKGKSTMTVRHLLSHQVGLPAIEGEIARNQLFDGTLVADALAAQSPLWGPGTGVGYHALTFGWLTGEVIRRVTGRSLGHVFAERIARPLDLDFWIGFPAAARAAYAPLIDGTPDPDELSRITDPDVRAAVGRVLTALADSSSLFSRVLSTNGTLPTPHAATWNDDGVLSAEQPAANGVTNARSLARMYAACIGEVDGIRLLSEETAATAAREQCSGIDEVVMGFSRFGTGYQLPQPAVPMLGPTSFGHAGAGGSLGFADRESRIGFGYVSNLLSASMANERRARDLVTAVSDAIGARS